MWADAKYGDHHVRMAAGTSFHRQCVTRCVYGLLLRIGWPWHNNRSAEILAVVRRGPFAKPTEIEQLEYLFTRVSKKDSRKDFEKHSLEHVLSFQRRVLQTKRAFMHRGQRTPLGVVEDYWDRTEAGRDMHSNLDAHDACVHRLVSGSHDHCQASCWSLTFWSPPWGSIPMAL
jgi:hypothetical protein